MTQSANCKCPWCDPEQAIEDERELEAARKVCLAVEHNPTSNQALENLLRAWRKIHDKATKAEA